MATNPYQTNTTSVEPNQGGIFTPAKEARATPVAQYTANSWTPTPESLVENRLTGLLQQDNPYMQAARTSGLQTAQSRGLLNSSMAGEASQAAAIKAAMPIASQDASAFTSAGMANTAASNQATQFNAGETNNASRLGAELTSNEKVAASNRAAAAASAAAQITSAQTMANAQMQSATVQAAAARETAMLTNVGSFMGNVMMTNNSAVNAVNLSDLSPEAKQAQIQQIEIGTRNASAATLAVFGLDIGDILGVSFGA